MSDLLAIVGAPEEDLELVDDITRCRPHRVTVLVQGCSGDWAIDDSDAGASIRERIATLLMAIEQRTGAAVVGLAGSREQLRGWRFDAVVGERALAATMR